MWNANHGWFGRLDSRLRAVTQCNTCTDFFSICAFAGVLFKRAGSAVATLFYKTGRSSWAETSSQARGFLHATKRHQLIEDGENVKTANLLKALGLALCVATASSAYAQASDAAPADTTAAPAVNPSKAMRTNDRKLGIAVRRALTRTQGFNVSNVFVRARAGAVTLSGTVPDGGQIQQAGDVAKGVPGVKSVNNRITLGVQGGGGG
jgi:hyperosmotically inducible periplasmic protein